jgi:hypothetical protein
MELSLAVELSWNHQTRFWISWRCWIYDFGRYFSILAFDASNFLATFSWFWMLHYAFLNPWELFTMKNTYELPVLPLIVHFKWTIMPRKTPPSVTPQNETPSFNDNSFACRLSPLSVAKVWDKTAKKNNFATLCLKMIRFKWLVAVSGSLFAS